MKYTTFSTLARSKILLQFYQLLVFFIIVSAARTKAAKCPLPDGSCNKLQHIEIFIEGESLKKIIAKREDAISGGVNGVLISNENDYVSARIKIDGIEYPIETRLKGDWADHLLGDVWSLRIKIKDSKPLGMKKFSIQDISRRNEGEATYMQYLKSKGILVPRYYYINYSFNGKYLGIIALEEGFEKELLTFQGKQNGPIFAYQEDYSWKLNYLRNNKHQDVEQNFTWYDIPFKFFSEGAILKNNYLRELLITSLKKLRLYHERIIHPDNIFDAKKIGQWVAIARSFGTYHAFGGNQRWYYNPQTQRLEPIAYDNLPFNKTDPEHSISNFPLEFVMSEEAIISYHKELRTIRDEIRNGSLLVKLKQWENELYSDVSEDKIRRFDFNYLQRFNDYMIDRPQELISEPRYGNYNQRPYISNEKNIEFPAFIHYFEQNKEGFLEIQNATDYTLNVEKIYYITPNGEENAIDIQAKSSFANIHWKDWLKYKVPLISHIKDKYIVQLKISDKDRVYRIESFFYTPIQD